MKTNKIIRGLQPPAVFILFLISSCSIKNLPSSSAKNVKQVFSLPDFSVLKYWASHPWKHDPADSIPAGIQDKKTDSLADVFFIYPTTYTDPDMPDGWNADVDNNVLNTKTDYSTILFQASVFNQHSRIFSPRYRQANITAFFTKDTAEARKAFDTAYSDIKKAFDYYLKNYNHGQPIIIASHSQGTLHAGRLLKEYFENKELQKQLVAAYIIGLPVFTNYFSSLQPCTEPAATGCFVSWRTFKEGFVPDYVLAENQKAVVINPLTWVMDSSEAPASLNKGGVLKSFNKIIPAVVSARIHGNILWTSLPKFFGNIFLRTKTYHVGDINLFYMNIRENVERRIFSYLKKKNF